MTRTRMRSWAITGAAALLALAGCGDRETADTASAGGGAPAAEPAPPQPPQEVRLEVDVAARQVRMFRRDQLERSYGIAVGRPEWPTQNGEWTVTQVVWNPGWTPPPDEEWTKDEEPKEPGDPDNPLGTVQMVYDPPRTIHGTNQPESIGKAASHGSIRMRNAEAEELAQLLMEAGGAPKDAAWIQEARANRKVRREVNLPNPIPIQVINGVDNADAVEGERDGGSEAKGSAARREPEKSSGGAPAAEKRSRSRDEARSRDSVRSDSASRGSRRTRSDTTPRAVRPDTT